MAKTVAGAPCVRKITFARSVTQEPPSPVLTFSATPAAGRMPLGEALAGSIGQAVPELDAYRVEAARGPYADKNGSVSALAAAIRGSHFQETLERVRDVTRPFSPDEYESGSSRIYQYVDYNFMLTRAGRRIPALLPYAGGILTDYDRKAEARPGSNPCILVASPLESLMLATAALRAGGMHAYPSLTVLDGHYCNPSVSVISFHGGTELHLLPFTPRPEPFSSIVLMSDVAMLAAAKAVLAEIKAMHLCASISAAYRPTTPIADSVLDGSLKSIANTLLEAESHWPQAPFVEDAVGFTGIHVYETVLSINKAAAQAMLAHSAGVNPYLLENMFLRSGSAEAAAAAFAHAIHPAGSSADIFRLWALIHDHAAEAARRVSSRLSTCLEKCRQDGPFVLPPDVPGSAARAHPAASLPNTLKQA